MRFGKLVAKKPTERRTSKGSVIWICECDCGNIAECDASLLKSNKKKSCGCLCNHAIKSTKKEKKLYDPETDCNCWRPATNDCRGCSETFCITRGYCKFYRKAET